MNKRFLLIPVIVVVLAALAAALWFGVFSKKDTRSLTVYRVDGQAEIARDNAGALPAQADTALQSGDRIRTAADGSLYGLLDGDRYVFADADTSFLLETKGNARDNSTVLTLDGGTLMLHVMSAISEKSEFSVRAADASFDVRSGSLRVEAGADGTRLYVFDGKVTVTPSVGESLVVTRGQCAQLRGGAVASVWDGIDYEPLSLDALSFLNVAAEKGRILSISAAELREVIAHNGGQLIVKFLFGEDVFATQTVDYGEHAHAPKLLPAPDGDWDFDFSEPVTEDTEIVWKR